MKRFPKSDRSNGLGAVVVRDIGKGRNSGTLKRPKSEIVAIDNALACVAHVATYAAPAKLVARDGLQMTFATFEDEGMIDKQVIVYMDAKATWDLYQRLHDLFGDADEEDEPAGASEEQLAALEDDEADMIEAARMIGARVMLGQLEDF